VCHRDRLPAYLGRAEVTPIVYGFCSDFAILKLSLPSSGRELLPTPLALTCPQGCLQWAIRTLGLKVPENARTLSGVTRRDTSES
jgi:hypothetical protein